MKKPLASKKLRLAGNIFTAVLGLILIAFATYFYLAFNNILIGDIQTDDSLVLLSELDQKKLEDILEQDRSRHQLPFPSESLTNPFVITEVSQQ